MLFRWRCDRKPPPLLKRVTMATKNEEQRSCEMQRIDEIIDDWFDYIDSIFNDGEQKRK